MGNDSLVQAVGRFLALHDPEMEQLAKTYGITRALAHEPVIMQLYSLVDAAEQAAHEKPEEAGVAATTDDALASPVATAAATAAAPAVDGNGEAVAFATATATA